jgi:RES domain-containing protein
MRRPLVQVILSLVPAATTFHGICFRNVSQRFASRQDILSARGSLLTGGRFNFRGAFELLYLSCDVHTCLEETTKALLYDGFIVAKALPRTIIGVEVELQRVLKLTDAAIRRRRGVTAGDLIRTDWQHAQDVLGREALTQEIGRLARDAGFEALLVPSAATRSGRNLDIFPDRLASTSYCRVLNADHLPLV